jgi:hypothetical protein
LASRRDEPILPGMTIKYPSLLLLAAALATTLVIGAAASPASAEGVQWHVHLRNWTGMTLKYQDRNQFGDGGWMAGNAETIPARQPNTPWDIGDFIDNSWGFWDVKPSYKIQYKGTMLDGREAYITLGSGSGARFPTCPVRDSEGRLITKYVCDTDGVRPSASDSTHTFILRGV